MESVHWLQGTSIWNEFKNPRAAGRFVSHAVGAIRIGGGGGIIPGFPALHPFGPALRAVQNRSRRFCRTQSIFVFVGSNCSPVQNRYNLIIVAIINLAEGVGFEPTKSLRPCRFSRPVPSTTRSPLRHQSGRHYITVRPLI
jgi:hypothetical protein